MKTEKPLNPNRVGRCLICMNKAKSRGLCMNHYVCFHRMVKKGKTTWKLLENANLAIVQKENCMLRGFLEFLSR